MLFSIYNKDMANEITKKALAEAFLKLLSIKPFKKITISDITEECGVNRMTFYYHFEDIYHLLNYCLTSKAKAYLTGKCEADTWMEGMESVFCLCLENQTLLINAYRFNSRGEVEKVLDPFVYQMTFHVVTEESKGHDVKEENLIFVANCYKHLLIGTVLDWVNAGMKEDYHIILKKIETMLSGETEWILSKFEEKQ